MGMTCAACSSRIEKVLNKQEGIKEATVNLTTENATVEYKPGLIDEKAIIDRIKKLGYDAKVKADKQEKQSQKEKELQKMKWKLVIYAILSIPLLVTMLDQLLGIYIHSIFIILLFYLLLA